MIKGIKESEAKNLILEELFDLTLYKNLAKKSDGDLRSVFEQLIQVETGHFAFWQHFFDLKMEELDFGRRFKMALLMLSVSVFGSSAMHLILEAIEVNGIRKYLHIWQAYEGTELGEAVSGVLKDELGHEDMIVSRLKAKQIDPEKIRSIFLGFNDGLVEILGAVSGFFAAFHSIPSVLVAWLTVTIAGAISMGAGAYAGASSEAEVRDLEEGKRAFLQKADYFSFYASPLVPAFYVGISYFLGSTIPIIPVFLGSSDLVFSIILSAIMIVIVSSVLGFLSGMAIGKRIFTNLIIIALAVAVTYVIGSIAQSIFGVAVH